MPEVSTRLIEARERRRPSGVLRVKPPPTLGTTCAGALRASFRVPDTALEGYTLYRGVDSEPDLEAAPWETFASLPHETAALTPGATYRFVLRYRNKYGLESQNISSWAVVVDGGGDAEAERPSAPFGVTVSPAAGGAVLVDAEYAWEMDGANAADQWLVYLTNTGVDPDPDVDSPTVVAIVTAAGHAFLSWTSSPQGDGADVRVLVRVRRSADTVDSSNLDVHSAVAETSGPAAVDGAAFLGRALEEGQE